MDKELNSVIDLNPRINYEDKKNFERNLFEAKASGIKLNKAIFVRAIIDKFNEDPKKVLKYLGIN